MHLYITINNITKKVYGGKSIKSVNQCLQYYGSGKIIKRAIKKYGIENFSKRIIKIKINDKSHLDKLERKLIRKLKYKFKQNCYNIHEGGTGGDLCAYMSDRLWVNKRISEGKRQQYAKGQTLLQLRGRQKQSSTLKKRYKVKSFYDKCVYHNKQKGKTLSNRIKEKGLSDKEITRNKKTGELNSHIITYKIQQPNEQDIIETSKISDFINKYKLETTVVSSARQNNNRFVIKRRTSRTRHPFNEGTVLTILSELYH